MRGKLPACNPLDSTEELTCTASTPRSTQGQPHRPRRPWSATHRKRAIWGWLGLVFALVALIMGGKVVEQKDISAVDSFSRESQQAERALTDAGLRPNEEVAFIQKQGSGCHRSGVRVAGRSQAAAELKATKYVENVVTPAEGGGAVSEDGHAVLIDFEITGTDLEAEDNVVPSEDDDRGPPEGRTPSSTSSRSGRPRRKEPQGDIRWRSRQGRGALPALSPC